MHADRTPPPDKQMACTRSPFRAVMTARAPGTLYALNQLDSSALPVGLGVFTRTSFHHSAVVLSEERARRDLPLAAIQRRIIPSVAGMLPRARSKAHHLMVAAVEIAVIQ